ncbi:putative extracellular exo-polygalacturonase [Halenospora varia]|nr:putative extracellular exo-polygalacturonase [Halenospora varia]
MAGKWGPGIAFPSPETRAYLVASAGVSVTTENGRLNYTICGTFGNITFPENQNYWIAERLNPVSSHVHINWKGQWSAGFVFRGTGISIEGFGTGGISDGDAWYDPEEIVTLPGRTMPFVFWNVSDVTSINIMNGTDIYFDNIHVNKTATNAPKGCNYVQNMDGFNTMDGSIIHLNNFVYVGGDGCISGNGVAIESLGHYLEDSSVENVYMNDLKVFPWRWLGKVHNPTFENVDATGAARGLLITQDNGNNGSYSGTSKMEISDIVFKNFLGTVTSSGNTASISCSSVYPCSGIYFTGMELVSSTGVGLTGSCKYTTAKGIHWLSGC